MVVKLLYFSAEWCGPCSTQSPIIDEIKEEYEDEMEINKIDIEENEQISSRYQVRSIPTIIVLTEDEDGTEELQDRFVGLTQKEDIEDSINAVL